VATNAANLDAALAQVTAELAGLNALKPDYSLDGESYQWSRRFAGLTDKLLALEQARQRADGAWEVRSRGVCG
jgi:hypothetical protein